MVSGKYTFWLMAILLPLVGVLAMLPLAWMAMEALAGSYLEYAARDAAANVRLVSYSAQAYIDRGDEAGLAALFREAGARSYTRFTVVDASGRVLADSDEDASRMENHANRPEVAAALAGKEGRDVRHSSTLDADQLYVAIPAAGPDGPLAIRSALNLGEVNGRLAVWRWRLLLGAGFAFLAMLALNLFSAWRFSKPLEDLAAGAARFSRGDLGHRLSEAGRGEARQLAAALNRMAAELESRFDQLERRRRELGLVLSSMDEGVLAVDAGGRVLFMNRAAEGLLGMGASAASGRFLGETARQPELLDFIKAAEEGESGVEREIRLVSRGGEAWVLARGGRLGGRDSGGGDGVVVVLHDLTRLRRLERVRRDFVANVSHELRTPATTIQGSLETLLDGALSDPESARKFLDMALRNCKRLNAIISNLLLLAGMEAGAGPSAEEESVKLLAPTLEAAVSHCREAAERRNIVLRVSCQEGLEIKANQRLVEQAVTNLVDNAIRHGLADAGVDVTAEERDGWVRIGVKDAGPGIEPRHAERLFERFYRVGGETEGSGLGLAIVKHIALAHGGEVALQSTPGVGSVFTLVLPAGTGA